MQGGERIRDVLSSWSLTAGIFVCALIVAFESTADWDVYVSGGLGIFGAIVDTSGRNVGPPDIFFFESDGDSSPLVDGALGLRIPIDPLVPREWLLDIRLPDWPVRIELEAAGLREFELETRFGGTNFFTSISATTVLVNGWVDIPFVETGARFSIWAASADSPASVNG